MIKAYLCISEDASLDKIVHTQKHVIMLQYRILGKQENLKKKENLTDRTLNLKGRQSFSLKVYTKMALEQYCSISSLPIRYLSSVVRSSVMQTSLFHYFLIIFKIISVVSSFSTVHTKWNNLIPTISAACRCGNVPE